MRFEAVRPLAQVTRSGVVESLHHGALVALAADGAVAFSIGDPDVAVYPRSALKPLQAAAMLAAGLELTGESLAIACGSHAGSPHHVAVVTAMLASAGLDPSALANTADLPLDRTCADDLVRAGGAAAPITQNCSGKHAAMLMTCVANGWPVAGYLERDHPLQRHLDDWIGGACGGLLHVGIDGCGAPTAMVSLAGLACAVRALVADGGPVAAAMRAHPDLVDGNGRADTELMRAAPGLVVKGGAEAVAIAAVDDGRTVALKLADGGDRARAAVLVAALQRLGISTGDFTAPPILGHGRPVGAVDVVWEHVTPDQPATH